MMKLPTPVITYLQHAWDEAAAHRTQSFTQTTNYTTIEPHDNDDQQPPNIWHKHANARRIEHAIDAHLRTPHP